MAGISDSEDVDDIKLHLESIVAADDQHKAVPADEPVDHKVQRESLLLPARLRARADKVLADVQEQVPGLSRAEVSKLLASRAGREALKAGTAALGRVDDHLQSRTGDRNPEAGKAYGVFGNNPTTFGGVARALGHSVKENARLKELAEDAPGRDLLFTPLVELRVSEAHTQLSKVLGDRTSTRADLSRSVSLKTATVEEARSVITAVRRHLYANLPDRKQDDDLRDYGFRPLHPGGGRPSAPIS